MCLPKQLGHELPDDGPELASSLLQHINLAFSRSVPRRGNVGTYFDYLPVSSSSHHDQLLSYQRDEEHHFRGR